MFRDKRVDDLLRRVEQLEKELWKIHNPPKFELGDKVKWSTGTSWGADQEGIVVQRNIFSYKSCTSYIRVWKYNVFIDKVGIEKGILTGELTKLTK